MALVAGETFRQHDDVRLSPYDRIVHELDDRETGRSNFVAFLFGGVFVAGGMLAFLYYDTSDLNGRDNLTTGSITRMATPGTARSIKVPVRPQPSGDLTQP